MAVRRVWFFLFCLAPALQAAEPGVTLVRPAGVGASFEAEGVVEAVRQSVIAAQVAGRIVELRVKAGDRVSAGQVLARIDAEAARQQVVASQAQVEAARAQLALARAELARQQQLFAKQYISQAALEQAEAQFKATEAAVRGTLAQAGAASAQTGFYTLTAPYAGVVSAVQAEQGAMAMPGQPLLTVYDPRALRVAASVPQSRVAALLPNAEVQLRIGEREFTTRALSVLPAADPVSHSQTVRLALPVGTSDLVPGQFARARFALRGDEEGRLLVPTSAVLRRSELTAVYVLDAQGQPRLRQVRLGPQQNGQVEVLAGLSAGERVLNDAQRATPPRTAP